MPVCASACARCARRYSTDSRSSRDTYRWAVPFSIGSSSFGWRLGSDSNAPASSNSFGSVYTWRSNSGRCVAWQLRQPGAGQRITEVVEWHRAKSNGAPTFDCSDTLFVQLGAGDRSWIGIFMDALDGINELTWHGQRGHIKPSSVGKNKML